MNKFPLLLAILLLLFAAARTVSGQSEAMHVPPGQPAPPVQQAGAAPQGAQALTLQDAEKIALQNHPRVQAAGYLALAAQARVGEV
ncbi:MAG TPA: hypothetical protein VOA88_05540, partial [Candidatus Dormibacteraeota bacterium]|nr:hypothetical protein [Candidatus Dormibacteraeota bacterium]